MIAKLKGRLIDYFPASAIMVGTLIIWELVTKVFRIPHYILPAPTVILNEINKNGAFLLEHLGWTMLEALGGFVIGSLIAFITAVIFVHIRLFERAFYPWAVVMQTIPIVALSPLFAIWMGYGIWHKIAIATVVSFFPVLVGATRGLRAVSPQALELMQILSAPKSDIFFRLRLPSSLPFLFAGLKISSTLSVIGAIIAEFNGASRGIGYLVYIAGQQMNTRFIFAGITFTSLAGILFFQAINLSERILLHWPGTRIDKE